jgi:hypothetical protein
MNVSEDFQQDSWTEQMHFAGQTDKAGPRSNQKQAADFPLTSGSQCTAQYIHRTCTQWYSTAADSSLESSIYGILLYCYYYVCNKN